MYFFVYKYLITTSIQAEKYKDLFFLNHDTKP